MRPVDLNFVAHNRMSIIVPPLRNVVPSPRRQIGLCGRCHKPLIDDLEALPQSISIRCPECGQFNIRITH